ncbi:MAG TPA: tRNA uridine-5-carboxymethylaminomethyl(34) synthesis GTPase MnmE [Hyphomicrobium sp.]|jgi:tRNA modification GTPase
MADVATIFALSTAPGRAGIAVVRVSGPRAGDLIDALAPPRPKKRTAALRRIRDPQSGETIDQGLVLWFAAPRTETGEDMAEFHLHGGLAIVKALLALLGRQPGCRLAEPGEFARRAFANGKLDLAQAEGLADLIDAETEAQRRQAMRQMGGALSRLYEGWRAELMRANALIEAVIDFSDESDVASDAFETARRMVGTLCASIAAHLEDGYRGEILREGFRVVLAGPPNVGKSSLLNALARRDAAIVSEEAGTTRDVIEVRLDLEGLPVIVSDTAGIREAEGAIEKEGIRRTLAHAREADLVVWLTDATAPDASPPPDLGTNVLPVTNKVDLVNDARGKLGVSAKTGAGIDALTRRLAELARERVGVTEAPVITHARYRAHLQECKAACQRFMAACQPGMADLQRDVELRAEDLRLASQALGRITGRVDVEDILGEIFGRFCIGK